MGKKNWSKPRGKFNHNRKPAHANRKNEKFDGNKPHQKTPRVTSIVPPGVYLFEKEVSITEYIGKTEGFKGIIKARFSDFQVNEIDLDGKIAQLTDMTVPDQPKCESKIDDETEVRKLVTDDVLQKIAELASSSKKNSTPVEIDANDLTKDQRSLIHNTIKKIHGTSLIGSTVDKGSKKFICFAKSNKFNQDQRVKWLWPHEYTHFIMFKTNIDTMKAAADLAKNLAINASSISYAGTKDKRAKTTQWLCLRKFQPDRIAKAAKSLSQISVGNFTFKPEPLRLGRLRGNRFRLALREVTAAKDLIEQAMQGLRDNGFINYYGLQRFGNSASVPTNKIGLALVQGQYKEACEFILKPRPGDSTFMAAVREHWWTHRNASAALKMLFKSNKSIEAKLLAGLSKHGTNDYVNALENVPRNVRLMYIHAYQSLIWNEMVTRRIKEFGIEVRAGDLVFVTSDDPENAADTRNTDVTEEQLDVDEGNDDDDENENLSTADLNVASIFKTMVKPITEADVTAGTYTVFDIVLPLPGHDITYPSNECGLWYEQRLAKDGLTSEKLKSKQKTYSLCGAYRKIFIKPLDLTWHMLKYNEHDDDLILSDLDVLNKEKDPVSASDGKHEALILELSLPSSSYATMALREILKEDTSKQSQTQLHNKDVTDEDVQKDSALSADTPGKRKKDEEDYDDDTDNVKRAKIN